jgi:hypothetical protein
VSENLGTATLELEGDLSPLGRTMDEAKGLAEKGSKSFGQSFKQGITKAVVPATAALGAIVFGAKKTVDAASGLGEQVNKNTVIFGAQSGSVIAWSQTLVDSFGLSQRAALESSGVFGNMLKPMGLAPPLVAKMSKKMVELGGDLASFNDASPEETLDALRAGLAGETEPLRRFGVFLNEARIKEEAMALGLYDGKGALDASAKAQATYSLILKDTKDAQGDFAKTSDSAANAERIQAAETENLHAKIGKGLLPAYSVLQGLLRTVTGFMSDHTGAVKIATLVIAGLAAGVLLVSGAMKVYAAGQVLATAGVWLFNAALAANPIVLVIAALVLLGAGFVVLWKKSETFRTIVKGAFEGVKKVVLGWARFFLTAVDWWLAGLEAIVGAVSWFAGKLGIDMGGVVGAVADARSVVQGLRGDVDKLKSKKIEINAVVFGLGSVAALAEHLALIEQRANRIAGRPAGTAPRVLAGNETVGRPALAAAGGGGGGNTYVFPSLVPYTADQARRVVEMTSAGAAQQPRRVPSRRSVGL